MIRLLLAIVLVVSTFATPAHAIDIREAQCKAGEIAIVRNIPETRTKTTEVTRWEERNGKRIPISDTVEQVVTEFVPVVIKKPIAFYRVSNIRDEDVGEDQVREALASKALVVFMFEELQPAKRGVFKPDTLFFQAKDNSDE